MICASQYVDLSSLSRKGVHNRLSGACSFIEPLETGTCTQYKMQILYCRQKSDSDSSTNFCCEFPPAVEEDVADNLTTRGVVQLDVADNLTTRRVVQLDVADNLTTRRVVQLDVADNLTTRRVVQLTLVSPNSQANKFPAVVQPLQNASITVRCVMSSFWIIGPYFSRGQLQNPDNGHICPQWPLVQHLYHKIFNSIFTS